TETDNATVEEPDVEELSGDASSGRKPGQRRRDHRKEKKKGDEFDSSIPFSWDPREVKHLTENRKKMSNEDLKEFMERDSDFQEKLEEIDEWKGFSRWEERTMVQKHSVKSAEEIAEELDRDTKEVELKMHMMGLVDFE
ncbi:MAG: hypothetical protein ABEJ66_02985, partial [Candidatus Nanohaloarchaea archaeon]